MRGFNDGAPAGEHFEFPLIDLPDGHTAVSPRLDNYRAGLPHPPAEESDEFKAEKETVDKIRVEMEAGVWPGWYFESQGLPGELHPALIAADPIGSVSSRAELAAMDQPLDLGEIMNAWLLSEGYIPVDVTSRHDFLGCVVAVHAACMAKVDRALSEAFRAKWWFGRKRPHEMFGREIEHSPFITPRHPAYPAGHGAAAGGTGSVLKAKFPVEAHEDIRVGTLQFAHLRTLLRVHWPSDNTAGYQLGARTR